MPAADILAAEFIQCGRAVNYLAYAVQFRYLSLRILGKKLGTARWEYHQIPSRERQHGI